MKDRHDGKGWNAGKGMNDGKGWNGGKGMHNGKGWNGGKGINDGEGWHGRKGMHGGKGWYGGKGMNDEEGWHKGRGMRGVKRSRTGTANTPRDNEITSYKYGYQNSRMRHSQVEDCDKAPLYEPQRRNYIKSSGDQSRKRSMENMKAIKNFGADWQSAMNFLESLENQLEANVFSYSACISVCARAKRWEKALLLLSRMESHGHTPDIYSFNSAISACEKGEQWEKALQLLDEMQQRRLEPDVISFNAAISACEKSFRHREADHLYQKAGIAGFYSHFLISDLNRLDLHGASQELANVILRNVLNELRSGCQSAEDFVIITGQGHNSAGAPVLRTSVRSYLREVAGPTISEVSSNPGCFILTKVSIEEWLSKM